MKLKRHIKIMNLNNIQFILISEFIISLNDKQKHYISASKLKELYNLSKYKCEIIELEMPDGTENNDVNPFQIILRPREFGDYK